MTLRCPSCLIRLALVCQRHLRHFCPHLSCSISARNLHDAGVREAFGERLGSDVSSCHLRRQTGQSSFLSSPDFSLLTTKDENAAKRQNSPSDSALQLWLTCPLSVSTVSYLFHHPYPLLPLSASHSLCPHSPRLLSSPFISSWTLFLCFFIPNLSSTVSATHVQGNRSYYRMLEINPLHPDPNQISRIESTWCRAVWSISDI